jgi:outer membrane protein assembly factor BamB
MKMKFWLLALLITGSIHVTGQVTAQWRGPDRSGSYPDAGMMKSWAESTPALLWSASGIGTGYASAVCDGQHIFVTGMKEKDDVMTCLSMDGKILWQTPVGPAFDRSFPDTRSTPAVDGNRVYAISGLGQITCLDTGTGKAIWSINGIETFGGVYGEWGVCESPLITGDLLIYTPAGEQTTMAALDKMSGKTVWKSESLRDTSAYVSPLLFRHGGRDIIATLCERWFFGVDAVSGKILWKYDFASLLPEKGMQIWPGAPRTNTNTPLYHNGMIYITGGYDHAGSMFRLSETGDAISQVWVDTVLDCHHGGVVRVGNNIYGSNWLNNSKGNWCCLDWNTGKVMYEHTWGNKGAIISAGNSLLCFDEKGGNLGLVNATPEKFDLTGSLKITQGKGPFWAHPTVFKGMILVRHGDVLMVYK